MCSKWGSIIRWLLIGMCSFPRLHKLLLDPKLLILTFGAFRFFKQLLLLFSVHQMSSGLFRLIGAVCKTMIMAYTGGSFLLLIIFMLGGFIIPRPAIKSWWIWGYWISPLAYAENAISINEMLAPRWSKVKLISFQTCLS